MISQRWQFDEAWRTNLIVDSSLSNHGNEDVIGFPDEFDILTVYLSEDSDSNAWTWERVAHDKVLVNAKLATKGTDFILEELKVG